MPAPQKKPGAYVLMTYIDENGTPVKTASISKEEFVKHFLPGFEEKKTASAIARDLLAEGFGVQQEAK